MSKDSVQLPAWLKRRRNDEALERAILNVAGEMAAKLHERRRSSRPGQKLSSHKDGGRKAHQAKMRVKRHKANKAARKMRKKQRAA